MLTSRAGAERFEEAIEYVKKYDLYLDALRIWRDDQDKYEVCCGAAAESSHQLKRINSFSRTFMEIISLTVANLLRLLLVRPPLLLRLHLLITVSRSTAYQVARKQRKAMGAFERAHAWQELFTIAINEGIAGADLAALSARVSGVHSLFSAI